MIITVDKKDIMELTGLPKTQATTLIRKAKRKLVKDGFDWYENKRVARVPVQTVESILGFNLLPKNGIMKNVSELYAVSKKEVS